MKEWAEYTIEYLMDNRENDWKIPLIKNVIVVDDFWLVPEFHNSAFNPSPIDGAGDNVSSWTSLYRNFINEDD